LPNRVMFNQLFERSIKLARRDGNKCAVLFIDLDRFKVINDSLGHSAGDTLLIEVAKRLRSCVRESDVVARLGGDEFVVMLDQISDRDEVAGVARKILAALLLPIILAGHECRTTGSVGIAMFPENGNDSLTLTKNADIAMYLAKEEGKNDFRFFSSEIKSQSIERLMLESDLRHALELDQLTLHYQPKLDVRTGRITGRAVRGKSAIAELDLVGGCVAFAAAGVDGWRLFDRGQGSTREQELADEFSQPEWKHFDAGCSRSDAQQQIGNHRSKHLQTDRIVVGAEELLDVEVLLDPSEQQFNLPAALVEGGDLDGRSSQIVGQKRHYAAGVAPDLDASQRYRQSGIALAGEFHLVIGDDFEAVADALANVAPPGFAKTHGRFRPGDEESLAIADLLPPVETAISLVEHVGRTGLDRDVAADLNVIDVGSRHLDAGWDITLCIVDDVQLHAADAAVPRRPTANLAQRDRTGVDQAHHLLAFAPQLPACHRRQRREGLRKNAGRTAGIGIRQRRAGQLASSQMIVVLRIGIEAGYHAAQAVVPAQLRIDQRHKVIPALERLVVGITVQTIHSRLKLPSIDRFKEPTKNAIAKSHARPSVSRQPEKTDLPRSCRACTVT
jgi:diguanylate cyclase (GGDEF)-like protein